jgi:hypothetical protein
MRHILRLRARRFHALHALLTGEVGPKPVNTGAIPDHLYHDLGLPDRIPQDRPVTYLGNLIPAGRLRRPAPNQGPTP